MAKGTITSGGKVVGKRRVVDERKLSWREVICNPWIIALLVVGILYIAVNAIFIFQ